MFQEKVVNKHWFIFAHGMSFSQRVLHAGEWLYLKAQRDVGRGGEVGSCFMPVVPPALDHQAGHQRGDEQPASEELKQPCNPPEPCVCDPTRQRGSGPSDDKLGGVRVLEREGDRTKPAAARSPGQEQKHRGGAASFLFSARGGVTGNLGGGRWLNGGNEALPLSQIPDPARKVKSGRLGHQPLTLTTSAPSFLHEGEPSLLCFMGTLASPVSSTGSQRRSCFPGTQRLHLHLRNPLPTFPGLQDFNF